MKGTVKMFDKEKGFGFIHGEDGKDYFFHYSAIVMDDFKTAEKGEQVEFGEDVAGICDRYEAFCDEPRKVSRKGSP